MVKINNYWYSYEEIKEALEKKGYTFLTLEVSDSLRDYPLYETYALKDGEKPTVLNHLKSVAIKEFEKKPSLI